MRNILALVGAATLTFLIVGWYLGWYEISGVRSPSGKQSVSVELHTGKLANDVGRAVDTLREKAQPDKPAPLTTPAGPASRFFGPEPAPAPKPATSGVTNGWRPITSDR
ncbi:MAG TPA: hypothetical protein VM597_30715 [Gemmataceae bacterium]|jgi:hypothetical protein|nr:hypothetical protein [Gemmataceae bacterium]